MRERIVYGQQDLLDAINDGIRAVTLCAGIYKIPIAPGVSFDRLGPVEVSVDGTRAEADAAGMEFMGIYPEYKSGYAVDRQEPLYTVAAVSSGSYGSFAGSYSGSFAAIGGSFAGSIAGSFGGSFSWYTGLGGSFTYGSFGFGSFASGGSFTYGSFGYGSFISSDVGSLGGSFTGFGGSSAGSGISGSLASPHGGGVPDIILGYGIDLI